MTSSPPPPPPRFNRPIPPGRGTGAPPSGTPPGDAPPAVDPDGKKKRGALFWIVGGCLGCVTLPILLTLGFAGAVGGGLYYMTKEPAAATRRQIETIRSGDLEAAYASLSSRYRAGVSRQEFGALVEAHPALRDNEDATFTHRALRNERVFLSGTLKARSGNTERVRFELIQEDHQWKIDSIHFGDDADVDKLQP